MAAEFRAFLDESSASRGEDRQEYLVCAALIPSADVENIRKRFLPLRLRGQIKLHWTDESETRRRQIVARIAELGQMSALVSHVSSRHRKTERFRRKCLEVLYYELAQMGVESVVCEARTPAQDQKDLAHIVALRSQGVVTDKFRIDHCRGGDDPLLWLPDILLGAVNSAYLGTHEYLDVLKEQIVFEARTPESL